MTKFSPTHWDSSKTIQQNADHFGICYNYASVLARENHLSFRRKKHSISNPLRDYLITTEEKERFLKSPDSWKPDKPHQHDGQTFGNEGAD